MKKQSLLTAGTGMFAALLTLSSWAMSEDEAAVKATELDTYAPLCAGDSCIKETREHENPPPVDPKLVAPPPLTPVN